MEPPVHSDAAYRRITLAVVIIIFISVVVRDRLLKKKCGDQTL